MSEGAKKVLQSIRKKNPGAGGFVQRWQFSSPLSDEQNDIVKEISGYVEMLEMGLLEDREDGPISCDVGDGAEAPTRQSSSTSDAVPEPEIESMAQFYEWYFTHVDGDLDGVVGANGSSVRVPSVAAAVATDDVDQVMSVMACSDNRSMHLDGASTDQEFARLRQCVDACAAVVEALETALADVRQLSEHYTLVATKTSELHSMCEEIAADQTRLSRFSERLVANIAPFAALDQLRVQLAGPGSPGAAAVGSPEFLAALDHLDRSLQFAEAHSEFRDARAYAQRFRLVRGRALGAVRTQVVNALVSTTQAVQKHIADQISAVSSANAADRPSQSQAAARVATGDSGSSATRPAGGPLASPSAPPSAGRLVAQAAAGDSVGGAFSEASLFYVRFKAVAPRVRPLVAEIERRCLALGGVDQSAADGSSVKAAAAASADVLNLLGDCYTCYFDQRASLVRAAVESSLQDIFEMSDVCAMVRAAAAYLMRVCELEHSLYKHFFAFNADRPGDVVTAKAAGAVAAVASGSAESHSAQSHSAESHGESAESNDDGRQTALVAAAAAAAAAAADARDHDDDVQGFSSSNSSSRVAAPPALVQLMLSLGAPLCATIRDAVVHEHDFDLLCALADVLGREILSDQVDPRGQALAAIRPVVERALEDVQERLIFLAQAFVRQSVASHRPTDEDLDYPLKIRAARQAAGRGNPQPLYTTWYPTLHRTLMLLSRLYRRIDLSIFEGLAQAAVADCCQSLVAASQALASRAGSVDGLLFLIRHLLILREQISPFDVDFAVTEKTLDFSQMRVALNDLVARRSSLWALLSNAMPQVLDQTFDSKKELEQSLKAAIEGFILLATQQSVQSLLEFEVKAAAFVRQLNAQTAQRRAAANNSSVGGGLAAQSFAVPNTVAQLVKAAVATLDAGGSLEQLVQRTALYLDSPAAQAVLFRPVRTSIMDCFDKLHALLALHYSPSERAHIDAPSVEAVGSMLDNLELRAKQAADAPPTAGATADETVGERN